VTTKRPSRTFGAVAVAALVLVGVVALVLWISPWKLGDRFGEQRTEHPNAVVLAELVDQSRYLAASGRFQTLLDVEKDTQWLPDVIKGERSLFVAEGDVEGSVDLSGLTEDSIKVSADGKTVTVHLPAPQLSRPRLDPDRTRLVSRDRGLVDRVGDALGGGNAGNQQELYQRAEQKVAEAADESDLRERTRQNTEQFLRSLLKGLGYEQVVVVFDGADPAGRR
jgi:hypothetical protein